MQFGKWMILTRQGPQLKQSWIPDMFQAAYLQQVTAHNHIATDQFALSLILGAGFNPKTTLQACCGYGGPYNYNPYVNCSNSGFVPPNSKNFVNINTSCSDPQAAIQWDGFHLTQAFYRQITKFFLAGKFVYPPLNLSQTCDLSFEDFWTRACLPKSGGDNSYFDWGQVFALHVHFEVYYSLYTRVS